MGKGQGRVVTPRDLLLALVATVAQAADLATAGTYREELNPLEAEAGAILKALLVLTVWFGMAAFGDRWRLVARVAVLAGLLGWWSNVR